MDLTHHPEYDTPYLYHRTLAQSCQAAVAIWRASNEIVEMSELALQWTPATAHNFVSAISDLFGAYNDLLWQEFHYCRHCGGQCCVVDAADVRPFDLIAAALLDLAPPVLPARIAANPHDCIYLAGSHCTWPTGWRTIKCWSFYCLGSGPWPVTTALGDLHAALMSRLQTVVDQALPEPLRLYERARGLKLVDALADPVDFAHILHTACHTLLVAPLHAHFPLFPLELPVRAQPKRTGAPIFLLPKQDDHIDEIYEFITTTTEALYEAPPATPPGVVRSVDQLLADLETLTWIIENEPVQRQQLLMELYQPYVDMPAPINGERPTLWYQMRNQILTLLHDSQ